MLEKFQGKIKIVFKSYPLTSHKNAREAAAAAIAAFRQGRFWEFHNLLFENQKALSPEKIRDLAKKAGLDMNRFEKEIQDPSVQQIIDRDIEEAKEAGVRGVPAMFLNGQPVKVKTLQAFYQMIESAIQKNE